MNWEVFNNDRSSLQVYRLLDNDDCKVLLKYNPRHQSARITCGNHHRLVFLESAGSLSGKTIFRNQYDMVIGSLVHDKYHPQEGTLLLDAKKYQYQLKNDGSNELFIFENGLQKPVAICGIPTTITPNHYVFSANTEAIVKNCYLLGLCWYLFLPLVKENILKPESAGA